jgi:arylsulfatase A-like enzyme
MKKTLYPCLLALIAWHCGPESPPTQSALKVDPATALSSSAAAAPQASGKRSVVHRLTQLLRHDSVSPEPKRAPSLKCLKSGEAPVLNPFSKLPKKLRSMHRRVSLHVENRLRYEMRDSLVFFPTRTFRTRVELPRDPRLEFFYAVDPCRYGSGQVKATVRLARNGRVLFERRLELKSQRNRLAVQPWTSVHVPLPFVGEEKVDVEVHFESLKENETPPIVWAQPLISGRVPPQDGAQDVNVLLVVIDAMRADTVGPARAYEDLAPTMNALFENGTSFKRAYSTSNQTRHSTLGMLTGQPPTLGGFYTATWLTSKPLRQGFYLRSPPLLPTLLSDAGYTVSTISHNRFQFDSHPFGIDHGFDHVYDDRQKVDETSHLVDRAIEHLETHKDNRFFLFLNLVSPHLPYKPPVQHQERIDALYKDRVPDERFRRYLAEVSYADAQLRRVLDTLERLELAEDTLIIVTADHGEVFSKDHRCWSKRYKQSCHYNHGMTLFDEEVHVPLALVWPGNVQAGQVIDTPTSHIHLAPTVLDLLGMPQEAKHVGLSFGETLRGEPAREERVYIESRTGTALIDGSMKFHTHSAKDDTRTLARMGGKERQLGPLPRYQLYDLAADPGETRNLILEDPDLAQSWNQKMTATRRLLASRLGSVERLSESQGSAAVNKLKLTSDGREHQLTGRISTKLGKLSCVQTQGHSSCTPLDHKTLKISLRSGSRHPELAFTSTPRDAPLRAQFTLDGQALPVDNVRLGPFGLRLLHDGQVLDRPQHLRLLTGRHGPKVRAKDDLALYMWRNPALARRVGPKATSPAMPPILGPDELDDLESKEDLSPELQGILQDLGYTQ